MPEGSEYTHWSDERLVAATGQGDRVAFEELYRRYRKSTLNLALKRAKDPGEAEDIVHEAFLALYYRGEKNSRIENVKGYLGLVVVNRCIKSSYAQEDMPLQDEQHFFDESMMEDAADIASKLEARERLVSRMTRLPREQRKVLILRFFEDMSYREISHRMGKKENTVRSIASRGINKLRKLSQ